MASSTYNLVQVFCKWCDLEIEGFGNGRTNVKKINLHTNGKCYANYAMYEKNIRQLKAYMDAMKPGEKNITVKLLLSYSRIGIWNTTKIKLGTGELLILTKKQNLINDSIPV